MKSGCDLYYYKREDFTLKEDFFVRMTSELIPVGARTPMGGQNRGCDAREKPDTNAAEILERLKAGK